MNKSELIAKLQAIPGDELPVKIFDWKKTAEQDSGEGTNEGIHDFEPELIDQWQDFSEDEKAYWMDLHDTTEPIKPWIGLTFDNPDIEGFEDEEVQKILKRSDPPAEQKELLWICVLIVKGKMKGRDMETMACTRKEAYSKLEKSSSTFNLKQMKGFGWKAVKIKIVYELPNNN